MDMTTYKKGEKPSKNSAITPLMLAKANGITFTPEEIAANGGRVSFKMVLDKGGSLAGMPKIARKKPEPITLPTKIKETPTEKKVEVPHEDAVIGQIPKKDYEEMYGPIRPDAGNAPKRNTEKSRAQAIEEMKAMFASQEAKKKQDENERKLLIERIVDAEKDAGLKEIDTGNGTKFVKEEKQKSAYKTPYFKTTDTGLSQLESEEDEADELAKAAELQSKIEDAKISKRDERLAYLNSLSNEALMDILKKTPGMGNLLSEVREIGSDQRIQDVSFNDDDDVIDITDSDPQIAEAKRNGLNSHVKLTGKRGFSPIDRDNPLTRGRKVIDETKTIDNPDYMQAVEEFRALGLSDAKIQKAIEQGLITPYTRAKSEESKTKKHENKPLAPTLIKKKDVPEKEIETEPEKEEIVTEAEKATKPVIDADKLRKKLDEYKAKQERSSKTATVKVKAPKKEEPTQKKVFKKKVEDDLGAWFKKLEASGGGKKQREEAAAKKDD
jgi:hypothetical protein